MISLFTGAIMWLVLGWQVQGGPRQTIQVTPSVHDLQPALMVEALQGNDPEYELQPAASGDLLNIK